MHKLFVLSHLRTLARLTATECTPATWEEVANRNTLAVSGDGMLYRLPREELKHALNTFCPINSLEQPHSEAIVLASKALRHHVKTDEDKHCARCPFVNECAHARKPHQAPENTNSLKDLLFYFHGLQHLLKPETIYYRQWVSAYRLGDSIIASIDDLSKGGNEIAEYDRLRVESTMSYKERVALKQKNAPEGEAAVKGAVEGKDFQNIMKKVEQVAQEKKSKKKAPASPQEANNEPQRQQFGRDFSFDEEAEFEPVKKFTKKSEERVPPITAEKGYQKIEQNEGRPYKGAPKSQNNNYRQERQPFNKFEEGNERQARSDYRKPYEKHYEKQNDRQYDRQDRDFRQPKFDKYERNDRGDRGDRGERGSWGDRGDRGESRGKFERKDWSGERERQFKPKQERYQGGKDYGNRFGDERRGEQQGYKGQRSDSRDDFPRIKQLNKGGNRDYNKERDSQQPYANKQAAVKPNPFVSKWKPGNEDDFEPSQTTRKVESEPAAKPRIIEMESINESTEGSASRPGRKIRSRVVK